MDKELTFELLMEKMENGNCPVCEMVNFRIAEALERFLYEGVNTPHVRYKVEKSNGFCKRHAHMLLKLGDPLTHAILYHDLMNNVIKNIGEKSNKTDYSNHKNCIFCAQNASNEDAYIKAFLEFYENDKFRQRYEQASTLCVVHLTEIKKIKFANKGIVKKITEKTLEKYKELNGHLSEIKRKNDYRHTDEEWTEEEIAAWQRAVAIFNGD